MLKAILIGSLVLAPFVIAGKVLLIVFGASQEVQTAYLVFVGVLAGIAGPVADVKVNGWEASRRHRRPPRTPA